MFFLITADAVKVLTGRNKRPLKSLSDMLKGNRDVFVRICWVSVLITPAEQ